MFAVILTYIKPIEVIDSLLADHRAYLDEQYAAKNFIVSGPRNPRVGGFILARTKNQEELQEILKKDPFSIYGAARYDVHEFQPVKWAQGFADYLD
jgi:uncharacterized protein YciI